jgi:acetyltransferase-like isoleucine patch superfamily enzyme
VGLGTHGFFGCAGGVEIGDDCIFGNFVSFHSENHNYSEGDKPIRLQGVTRKGIKIGRNCWLGAKATILDGVMLGEGSIVAAGAVVRAGIYPANIILGGVPARILRKRTTLD